MCNNKPEIDFSNTLITQQIKICMFLYNFHKNNLFDKLLNDEKMHDL